MCAAMAYWAIVQPSIWELVSESFASTDLKSKPLANWNFPVVDIGSNSTILISSNLSKSLRTEAAQPTHVMPGRSSVTRVTSSVAPGLCCETVEETSFPGGAAEPHPTSARSKDITAHRVRLGFQFIDCSQKVDNKANQEALILHC